MHDEKVDVTKMKQTVRATTIEQIANRWAYHSGERKFIDLENRVFLSAARFNEMFHSIYPESGFPRNAASALVRTPEFTCVEETVYVPGQPVICDPCLWWQAHNSRCFNAWVKHTLKPVKGDVSFLESFFPDPWQRKIFLQWLARIVHDSTGEPPSWAIQMDGKAAVVMNQMFKDLFGEHNALTIGRRTSNVPHCFVVICNGMTDPSEFLGRVNAVYMESGSRKNVHRDRFFVVDFCGEERGWRKAYAPALLHHLIHQVNYSGLELEYTPGKTLQKDIVLQVARNLMGSNDSEGPM
jgi:hypothetical protein